MAPSVRFHGCTSMCTNRSSCSLFPTSLRRTPPLSVFSHIGFLLLLVFVIHFMFPPNANGCPTQRPPGQTFSFPTPLPAMFVAADSLSVLQEGSAGYAACASRTVEADGRVDGSEQTVREHSSSAEALPEGDQAEPGRHNGSDRSSRWQGVDGSISFLGSIKAFTADRLVPFLSAPLSIFSYPKPNPYMLSVKKPSTAAFSAAFRLSTPPMAQLDEDAALVAPIIERMQRRRFFRIFRVDLERPCPFWAVSKLCSGVDSGGDCSVCPCHHDDVPTSWRLKPVENFSEEEEDEAGPDKGAVRCGWGGCVSGKETGGRVLMCDADADESSAQSVRYDYVDLFQNPPGFTGFLGSVAWAEIYQANCMAVQGGGGGGGWNYGLALGGNDDCLEEEQFYRLLSGLHSNIAALSSEYYYKEPQKQVTNLVWWSEESLVSRALYGLGIRGQEEGRYNTSFFMEKLGSHPDWIGNLYFTFSVILRTVCHVAPVLQKCSCHTGTDDDDLGARADLFDLLNHSYASCDSIYMKQPLFDRRSLDVRRQFHNITRLLDCLECEKCRLHGKVKMTALDVALRAASADSPVRSLERCEVAALVNSLAFFTDAIQIVSRFEHRIQRYQSKLRVTTILTLSVLMVSIVLSIYALWWRKPLHKRS
eukprot:GHVS01082949.1.p1 GENE.GHVS01082949.1~~GHVS01082949.1.p1  ORF type:complete len:648 (-),score=72.20 GHVS01082949.1:470-2413(-)